MRHENHILDEAFLDEIFEYMFGTKGSYLNILQIQDGIEEAKKKDFNYSDLVLALEQLELDGFLNLEDEKRDDLNVYRLTYKGHLEYKSSKRARPYADLIRRNRSKKITTMSTRMVIAMNAIAILIITGWSVYSDQKDAISESRIISIEKKLEELKSQNEELLEMKNENCIEH